MSDSHHTRAQTWIAGISLVFLVLAFFGVSRVTDFLGNGGNATVAKTSPAGPTATPSAPPSAAPVAASVPALSGERPEIVAKGVRASLSEGPDFSAVTRELDATVTVKLHNGSKFPVKLAWLAAADNASLDLGIGRLATARATSRFAGMPNCSYATADQCRPAGGTELAPGETSEFTMTLQADVPAADIERALRAKRGIFTARLSVYPPAPAASVEKTISVNVSVER